LHKVFFLGQRLCAVCLYLAMMVSVWTNSEFWTLSTYVFCCVHWTMAPLCNPELLPAPSLTNLDILAAACCSEHFFVFYWHACEHVIVGTNCSNSFCRMEKRSWSWPGHSCSLPLCLCGLGEHPLVPSAWSCSIPLPSRVVAEVWSGHRADNRHTSLWHTRGTSFVVTLRSEQPLVVSMTFKIFLVNFPCKFWIRWRFSR
jgi:hypothetical protein